MIHADDLALAPERASGAEDMGSPDPARRPRAAGRRALRLNLRLAPGMRVGLYGGSFNPAHEGHAHVAETARRRLGLDKVIWLVSPQNPLKPAATERLERRLANRHVGWRKIRPR